MARPGKIKTQPNHKVTALATEGAMDRFDPGVHAAADGAEATISIYGVIGEDFWTGEGVTVKRIDAALRAIGPTTDVVVNMNSPGGDVFEGIAIYNRFREHQAKVTVKILGLAASAASVIAMAADEVQIGKASFFMIHNAWVMAVGNRHDLKEVADWLEPFDKALAGTYEDRTGLAADVVAKMMDEETWLNGEDAVAKGFADGLLAADEVKVDPVKNAAEQHVNAIRRAEAALTKEMPRSAARNLLNQIKGTPGATLEATPDAGTTPEFADEVGSLMAKFRS